MSSSRDIVGEKNEQLLMTEKRKYPEVFKWKIAVIVIVVLIAIILVVDLIMFLYLKNHELRKHNYTFAAQMVNLLASTTITRQQFVNLIGGLTNSYTDIWFQNATRIASWSASSGILLNLDQVATFFDSKVTDRITLVQFAEGDQKYVVGAFTHIPFQLPTDTWKEYLENATHSYYNFEIDEKESTMFGSNSEIYLKMNETADNLANCRLINLKQTSLSFLLGAEIRLSSSDSPAQAQIKFLNSDSIEQACFSTENYEDDLVSAVGPVVFNEYYDLVEITTFSLIT